MIEQQAQELIDNSEKEQVQEQENQNTITGFPDLTFPEMNFPDFDLTMRNMQ